MKSVTTLGKTVKTYKSSNYSAINKLSQQLDEERREREKMRKEIEDLKKMNSDLCNAILASNSSMSHLGGGGSPTKK